MELKVTKDNIDKYKEKILPVADKAGKQVVDKIFGIINQLLDQAKGFVDVGAVQNAKQWNKLLQLQLELINDIPNQSEVKEEAKEDEKVEKKED